ncbi:uncharacterized protein LOC131013483 [Salvia miltiorrhiza]|uniref:uncharacterized protein LOC131013483 n=1 Tax=Salvia miltiorrhiza TaxID=226208 RepID=UPI0025ABA7C3|nr:uncharacterized protein LOC131013483 [Salvia miltiorrhiza]XP_057797555.1 uncharacterized protein LOC131013483 [Salvia miltiorrhiza]XP_057797556.1 uncharacterized protein LOC131013483 [Salvia miltiorrhiza]XP_057797557.1 uncharacterized protein LOC131013483 [Salvia miltiorrhiza]XP_057797558.1 uncharacterized protein LOC131013483 [Salvia miltiorrhiza]
MVFFMDVCVSNQDYLVILDNKEQSTDKGTRLKVHKPLIGHYARRWPRFTNPLHKAMWTREARLTKTTTAWTLEAAHHQPTYEVTPLLTLGRRIAEGNAKWRNDMQFFGEFRYIKGYWEWSEDVLSRFASELRTAGIYDPVYASLFTYDRNTEVMKAFCEAWCPTTNTLLTLSGELSISLWDLQFLFGLPAIGRLYDEVVPCTKELLGVTQDGSRFVPVSCKYLLHAYHAIGNDNGKAPRCSVTIEEWIKFWSKKKSRYQPPPPRKEKKSVRSKATHNPTGELRAHEPWSSVEKGLFVKLKIDESYWDETYLAAYLACWLCSFVLPEGDATLIRPSTFKMACIMASQQKVVLTVPVLASIFRGLNKISDSVEPFRLRAAFPAHFVYAWMAYYFKIHFPLERDSCTPKMVQYSGEGGARFYDDVKARKQIRKGDQVAWSCTMYSWDKDISFIDDENAKESDFCYFMAVRSNYLTRRLEDGFVVEPYSPHRFSRQFGFYQVRPGVLSHNFRKASLEEGLKYWDATVLRKSASKALLPCVPLTVKKLSSADYKDWRSQVYKRSFEQNVIQVPPKTNGVSKNRDKADQLVPPKEKRKVDAAPLGGVNSSSGERHWKRKRVEPVEFVDEHSQGEHHDSSKTVTKTHEEVLEVEEQVQGDRRNPSFVVDEAREEAFDVDAEESSQDNFESIEGDHLNAIPVLNEKASDAPTTKVGAKVGAKIGAKIGAISEFNSTSIFYAQIRLCLKNIWGVLRDKIVRMPAQHLSSIEEEVRVGISRMKGLSQDFDLSHLEASIDTLFIRAATYDKARLASHEFGASSGQQFRNNKARLHDAWVKEKEEIAQVKDIKKELAELKERKDALIKSLRDHSEVLQTTRDEITGLNGAIEKYKNSPLIDDEIVKKEKDSERLLMVAQKSLEDQDPFA